MGAVLRRAAFSTNIKDRLELCAQAAHIPVHLGSMAFAMQALVAGNTWAPGDVVIVNDPFLGGTHLPDITLISPVFVAGVLVGFVANRAHHADIGADSPGSMPISRSLEEEGLVIPPTQLLRGGQVVEVVMQRIVPVNSVSQNWYVAPGWMRSKRDLLRSTTMAPDWQKRRWP